MVTLDVKGLPCPMPLLKLKKSLAMLGAGETQIKIIATDKGVLNDIPAFCQQQSLKCSILSDELPYQLSVEK